MTVPPLERLTPMLTRLSEARRALVNILGSDEPEFSKLRHNAIYLIGKIARQETIVEKALADARQSALKSPPTKPEVKK